MRIAFRVDSSQDIGTGHLMRCLTLAHGLRAKGAQILFIMRDLPGALIERPAQAGFACSILARPSGDDYTQDLAHSAWLGVDQSTDALETLEVLGDGVDWMVVDHYAIDRRWQGMIRQRAAKIMVIDDIADRYHDCDLLLDQNLQNAPGRYDNLIGSEAKALLGPRYALLRERFAELRPQALARERGGLDRVLVFLGGVDAAGATLMALHALATAGIDSLHLDVVVGPSNPDLGQIREWCDLRPRAQLYESSVELADLMLVADLSIGAAGSTSWERCCMGLPTVVLTVAENQRDGAQALARAGAAIWAGDVGSMDVDDLVASLSLLRSSPDRLMALSITAADLVDGEGCARIVHEVSMSKMDIRCADRADGEMVWSWRNDEETRKWSRDNRIIPLDDHLAWFNCALVDERRRMLIGEDALGPVGFVRFDIDGCEGTISIFLAPERRGRGLGGSLLAKALDWLKQEERAVSVVRVDVLAGNQQSARMYESAGFARWGEEFRLAINGDHQ